METLKRNRTNTVTIVGVLTNHALKTGTARNGKPYMNGTITIEVARKVGEQEVKESIVADVMSMQFTSTGGEAQFFTTLSNINNLVGKKVNAWGSLDSQSYVRRGTANIANSTRIAIRSLREETKEDDKAVFEIGGYTANGVSEAIDPTNNSLLHYVLPIKQVSYKDNIAQPFELHIEAGNTRAYDAFRLAENNKTYHFLGEIHRETFHETITKANLLGGEITETRAREITHFYVTAATLGTPEEDYTPEDIQLIEQNQRKYEDDLIKAAQNTASANTVTTPTQGQPLVGSIL